MCVGVGRGAWGGGTKQIERTSSALVIKSKKPGDFSVRIRLYYICSTFLSVTAA